MGELLQPWHLLVILTVFGIFFVIPAVFYFLTLQRTLAKCAPSSRTMDPGMVWLGIVPFVNLVFSFFLVAALAKSLHNEFSRRAIPVIDPQPGRDIGLAMSICACCSLVPYFGALALLATLVLWIIYWARIAEYSRMLDLPAQAPYPA